MLVLTRKEGERLIINSDIIVTVVASGRVVNPLRVEISSQITGARGLDSGTPGPRRLVGRPELGGRRDRRAVVESAHLAEPVSPDLCAGVSEHGE